MSKRLRLAGTLKDLPRARRLLICPGCTLFPGRRVAVQAPPVLSRTRGIHVSQQQEEAPAVSQAPRREAPGHWQVQRPRGRHSLVCVKSRQQARVAGAEGASTRVVGHGAGETVRARPCTLQPICGTRPWPQAPRSQGPGVPGSPLCGSVLKGAKHAGGGRRRSTSKRH